MTVQLPGLSQQDLPEITQGVGFGRVAAHALQCAEHFVAAQRLAHTLVLATGAEFCQQDATPFEQGLQRSEAGTQAARPGRRGRLLLLWLNGLHARGHEVGPAPAFHGERCGQVDAGSSPGGRRRTVLSGSRRGRRCVGARQSGRRWPRPHRHEAQVRQDAVAGQLVVQGFQQGRIQRHQDFFELPVELERGMRREVELAACVIQRPAKRIRADRQVFAIEGWRAREHAEALAHQLQGQAVARFDAAGDVVEQRLVAHRVFVEQGQAHARGLLFLQPAIAARLVQPRQACFDIGQEAVGEALLADVQVVQRDESRGFDLRILDRTALAGQRQFGFQQNRLQLPVHVAADDLQDMLQHLPHATRQRGIGKRSGGVGPI